MRLSAADEAAAAARARPVFDKRGQLLPRPVHGHGRQHVHLHHALRGARRDLQRHDAVLRRHLHEELPSLEEVSASLAMTPQTLRRRLQREGQGFQAISSGQGLKATHFQVAAHKIPE